MESGRKAGVVADPKIVAALEHLQVDAPPAGCVAFDVQVEVPFAPALTDEMRRYFYIGGMPEIVASFSRSHDDEQKLGDRR